MMRSRKILLTSIVSCACCAGYPQKPIESGQYLSYQSFIELVWRQNLGYAVEKLNVDVAVAELKAARVFNDPSLSIEYSDNDDNRMKMGRSVSAEISKTFSIGKRGARIDLAKSEKELSEAILENYFHTLRAEATLAYLEAVRQAQLYYVRENSYENILRLAEGDSIRFALGKISETDALQSRLEAETAANELLQAQTEAINAFSTLVLWTGGEPQNAKSATYTPSTTKISVIERLFDDEQLQQTALTNRADLTAALKNVDVAQKELKVARRERLVDFDIALGYNYNTEVRNEIAPAPQFNGITLGVAVPLKLSNVNKGAIHAAKFRQQQAEINYKQAALEVQNSVAQSLRQYRSALEQAKRFEKGLLNDANAVLNGKIYSYERGETSRLEVLIAQQTYDNMRIAYIETVYNSVAALVELERNAGIWDITIE